MAQAKYYLALVAVCLVWGATPACGKILSTSMSPLLITGLRFVLTAGILFSWLFITGQKKAFRPDKKFIPFLIFMGFMGITVHNGLLFTGLHYTTATNTALIESIGPTATTILAFLFVGERLSRRGWVGIFISCCGALCIVTKGSLDVLINMGFNIGDLLIVACEIAWSCYVILGWKAQKSRLSATALTAWNGLFGGLLCFIIGFATGTLEVWQVNAQAVYGFLYLLLASGVFAFVTWNFAVAKVGASKAGVFVYLVPLTGAIIGVTFLGEEILLSQIVGGLLIISGVVVTVRAKVQLKSEEKKAPENLVERFPDLAEHYRAKASGKEVPALPHRSFATKLKGVFKRTFIAFYHVIKAPADAVAFLYKFFVLKEKAAPNINDDADSKAESTVSLGKSVLKEDQSFKDKISNLSSKSDTRIYAGAGNAQDVAGLMRELGRKNWVENAGAKDELNESAGDFVKSIDKGDEELRIQAEILQQEMQEFSACNVLKKWFLGKFKRN